MCLIIILIPVFLVKSHFPCQVVERSCVSSMVHSLLHCQFIFVNYLVCVSLCWLFTQEAADYNLITQLVLSSSLSQLSHRVMSSKKEFFICCTANERLSTKPRLCCVVSFCCDSVLGPETFLREVLHIPESILKVKNCKICVACSLCLKRRPQHNFCVCH